MVEWSAISAIATVVRTVHEIVRDFPLKDRMPSAELPALPPDPPATQPERYQVALGRRHKFLREKILKLNPREMADLYGFERVAYLEDCEAGLDEFPTAAMQRLVQVFFISPKYLQEGEEKASIFQSFRFSYEKEDCRRFLEEEFQPTFLCQPDFHKDGLTYLVFSKCDEGYWRMIKSNCYGSFYSNGGGKDDIHNLIYAMLDLNIRYSRAGFLNVKQAEWETLLRGCWYNKGMLGYNGAANYEAYDIFERWYNEAYERRSKLPEFKRW